MGYEEEWIKQHPLDGDGVSLHFYHMLQKNVVIGKEGSSDPVRIPETVVYEHNFPQAWFSYDEENNELIKRPGKMLDAATMYQYFSVPCPGAGGVVAQFFHVPVSVETSWGPHDVLSQKDIESGKYDNQQITYTEFFTAETLSEFLFGQHRKPNGVLQRFVLPKGQGMSRHNMQIEVVWTPAITSARVRINRQRIDDRTASFTDRLTTFDGAPDLSDEMVVAEDTKLALTEICHNIADHFHRTEKRHLARLLLYFKVDDRNALWLLWCGGFRTEAAALSPSFTRIPLMLHMRREVVGVNSTTLERLFQRRQNQKRLLALDYEWYELTRNDQFCLTLNSSHRRQAAQLRQRGLSKVRLSEKSSDPRRNPHHPLHESFVRVCDDADLEKGAVKNVGKKSKHKDSCLEASGAGSVVGLPVGFGLESDEDESCPAEVVREKVLKELIALGMDAWYELYSSTLSTHPEIMPTSRMTLAAPLAHPGSGSVKGGVLQKEEHETLTQILRISVAGSQIDEKTHSNLALGSGSPPPTAVYFADYGVLLRGRREDRPSSQVEQELKDFFLALFERRGEEIIQECRSRFPSFFSFFF